MKKIKFMMLIMGLSGLLQAGECKIDYMGTLEKENILSYKVNDKSIIVTLDRGIVYRIFSYIDGQKKETFREAFIFSDKICFGTGMTECMAVSSLENNVLAETFLANTFCKE